MVVEDGGLKVGFCLFFDDGDFFSCGEFVFIIILFDSFASCSELIGFCKGVVDISDDEDDNNDEDDDEEDESYRRLERFRCFFSFFRFR